MSGVQSTDKQHFASTHPQSDWQRKLESLQNQHQHETLQQQQEHLEQLKILQQQLLQDLSISAAEDTSMDATLLPENTSTHHASGSETPHSEEAHILTQSAGHSQTPSPSRPANTQPVVHSSPNKEKEFVKTDLDVSTFSSTHSLEFLQLPPLSGTNSILHRTSSTHSVDEETKTTSPPNDFESQSYEETKQSGSPSNISKVPSFTKHFRYQSPPRRKLWAYSVGQPPSPLNTSLQAAAPSPTLTSVVPAPHHQSPGSYKQLTETQSRGSMLDKHRKHIEDLKKYYETELSSMQTKLNQLEVKNLSTASPMKNKTPERGVSPLQMFSLDHTQNADPVQSPSCSHQIIFPSSLAKERRVVATSNGDNIHRRSASPTVLKTAHEAELRMLESENGRLKEECTKLQAQLDETERERFANEGQTKRLQQHVYELQDRCESSERMVSMLQERLETTRTQLYNQDKLVGQLQSDLQVSNEELHFWKEQRSQDIEKLEQLFNEFEVLQTENKKLHAANGHLEAELDEMSTDLVTVKASLDKYYSMESQYKSTIHRLEDEIRHLQHVNNRLHSQATHYDLGVHGTLFNRADEEKVQHRSIHSPNRQVVTSDLSSRRQTNHSVPSERTFAGVATSLERPLTRKKWLEPSVPGLICGGGDTAHHTIPVSASRTPTRISLQEDSRTVKNTPVKRSPFPKTKHKTPSPQQQSRKSGGHVATHDEHSSPLIQAARVMELNVEEQGENPVRLGYDEAQYQDLADSTLKAIKDGTIITSDEKGHPIRRNQKGSTKQSIDEQLQQHIKTVTDAENKLVALQTEKEKLMSALQKTPKSGSRVSRQLKQNQIHMEQRLEDVIREIGSVRMTLRRHHALKK